MLNHEVLLFWQVFAQLVQVSMMIKHVFLHSFTSAGEIRINMSGVN